MVGAWKLNPKKSKPADVMKVASLGDNSYSFDASCGAKSGKGQARPANSPVSVDTFTFSPSLMNRGTRISSPVSRRAGLVTLPLDESPRTPGSVNAT